MSDSVTYAFIALDAVLVVLCLIAVVVYCKTKRTNSSSSNSEVADESTQASLSFLKKKTGRWTVPYDELIFGKILGKGSQGEVFRATWRGSAVAVKKIDTRIVAPEIIDEFCQEAEIMRQLRHPCLTLFMGISLENPHLCIVTEIVDRGSLFDIMHDEHSALSWKNSLRIAADVAQGMTYLHSHQPAILHRDLKSLNILVDSNWRGKVADFGMSRFNDGNGTMTQCGSPLWMAPEMIKNEHYDAAADVYSFGICLWELYVRKIPYRNLNLNPSQLVVKVVRENIRPPIPRTCPKPYAKLMQKCWHPAALKRPPFGAILNVLNAFLSDPAIYQHQPGNKEKPAAAPEDVQPEEVATVLPKVEINEWKIEKADIQLGPNLDHHAQSTPRHTSLTLESKAAAEIEVLGDSVQTTERRASRARAGQDWFRGTFRGAEVAVKRCFLDKDLMQRHQTRILELAKLTSDLRHPNILLCMGSYVDSPSSEVGVMCELMRHLSLHGVLQNRQLPLDWDQTMQMIIDAAQGLAFLHGVPIVHEQFNTHHLLVDSHWRVKVANPAFVDLRANLQGNPLPATLLDAPEVLNDPRARSQPSNVYNYGMVALEILWRRPPHSDNTPLNAAFITKVNEGYRPTIPPSTTPTMASLIRSCWNADPKQRPQMARVAQEVQMIKEQGPPPIKLELGVNAKLYVKKKTVFAYRSKDPVTIMKDWGKSQGAAGCYVICAGDGDAYTIGADVLESSYERVVGGECEYRKIGTVMGRGMEEPFALKKAGNIENGQAGDFVLQNEAGEQWLVEESKFRQLYMTSPVQRISRAASSVQANQPVQRQASIRRP